MPWQWPRAGTGRRTAGTDTHFPCPPAPSFLSSAPGFLIDLRLIPFLHMDGSIRDVLHNRVMGEQVEILEHQAVLALDFPLNPFFEAYTALPSSVQAARFPRFISLPLLSMVSSSGGAPQQGGFFRTEGTDDRNDFPSSTLRAYPL